MSEVNQEKREWLLGLRPYKGMQTINLVVFCLLMTPLLGFAFLLARFIIWEVWKFCLFEFFGL